MINWDYINNNREPLFEQLAKTRRVKQPFPHNTDNAEFYATVLKNRPTKAEAILRAVLDPKEWEFQAAIMCYVADFINYDKRIIIEVDGLYHTEDPKWAKRDKEREQYLLNYGFNMLRFTNEQVEQNLTEVKLIISGCLWWARNYKSCLPPIPHQKSYFAPVN